MNKTKIIRFIVSFLFFILAGGIYLYTAIPSKEKANPPGVEKVTKSKGSEESSELNDFMVSTVKEKVDEPSVQLEKEEVIYVHVCGSVVAPGVYELTNEARVLDAIIKASGFCDGAAKDAINQAQLLYDGQRLYIPSLEEIDAGFNLVDLNQDQNEVEEKSRINLNVASKEELMSLPGIGESKAESIISYREEHKGFKSIEDIQKIAGIKEAVFQKVKDYIVVK